MGNITIQGDLTGDVPGGEIGGASSVTTGGVLYGTAAGVAGTSADLFWDAATSVLAVRRSQVNSPVTNADLPTRSTFLGRGSAGVGANPTLSLFTTATGNGIASFAEATYAAMPLALQPFGGNLLLGTTTDDGTNRLQVAGSVRLAAAGSREILMRDTNGSVEMQILVDTGSLNFGVKNVTNLWALTSSGTQTLYNQTPTTGVTQLLVRAGAGQSSTNLMTWQNSAGTQIASVSSGGGFFAPEFETSSAGFSVGSALARGANNFRLVFSSTGSYAGSADTGLARNAAGILEVNSGTAGTFRDLYLRGIRPVGVTVANLPAAASNTGMMATVTDANATTIGTTVAGGGANTVLVWSNGTNWKIYAS